MKIGVGMDGNGHFRAANIQNRKDIINVLQYISEGEWFDHIASLLDVGRFEKINWNNPDYITELEWNKLMRQFEQRGTFEIVDIK